MIAVLRICARIPVSAHAEVGRFGGTGANPVLVFAIPQVIGEEIGSITANMVSFVVAIVVDGIANLSGNLVIGPTGFRGADHAVGTGIALGCSTGASPESACLPDSATDDNMTTKVRIFLPSRFLLL